MNTESARLKPRLHVRFFACTGDAIFQELSRRQRTVKIARVATHEHATRQLKKKTQKKVARVEYLLTKSPTLSLV